MIFLRVKLAKKNTITAECAELMHAELRRGLSGVGGGAITVNENIVRNRFPTIEGLQLLLTKRNPTKKKFLYLAIQL